MDKFSEPITVSATVLSRMFVYLSLSNVEIDPFLRSLGVDPESGKFLCHEQDTNDLI